VALLRSTKTVPANATPNDCQTCPAAEDGSDVLKFNDIKVDRVDRSETTCEVYVTMRATFNPSTRQNIAGGLTGWISPGIKEQLLRGETPAEQQTYKVKVIYRRTPKGWRPVEFDRA